MEIFKFFSKQESEPGKDINKLKEELETLRNYKTIPFSNEAMKKDEDIKNLEEEISEIESEHKQAA